MEHQNSVADLEIRNFLADCRNFAGCLVSIYPRGSQQIVFDLLQIGMTNTAAMNLDEDFSRSDVRHRNRLNPDSALADVYGCLHGLRQTRYGDCRLYFRIDSWQ